MFLPLLTHAGRRRPHPRHWLALSQLVGISTSEPQSECPVGVGGHQTKDYNPGAIESHESDWERVNRSKLGEGGQSVVYLVCTPERTKQRARSLKILNSHIPTAISHTHGFEPAVSGKRLGTDALRRRKSAQDD